jgi:hypothetical protein
LTGIKSVVHTATIDRLLEVIVREWEQHKLIMTMIRDILMYMVRTPVDVSRERAHASLCISVDVTTALVSLPCSWGLTIGVIRALRCDPALPPQDKTYCRTQKKVPVYDMGLLLFRDHVVKDGGVTGKLKQILLENVNNERQGT